MTTFDKLRVGDAVRVSPTSDKIFLVLDVSYTAFRIENEGVSMWVYAKAAPDMEIIPSEPDAIGSVVRDSTKTQWVKFRDTQLRDNWVNEDGQVGFWEDIR